MEIMILAAAGHEAAEPFLSQYKDLLANPAHWAFELSVEAIVFTLGFILGRGKLNRWITRLQHKHDVEVHGFDAVEET